MRPPKLLFTCEHGGNKVPAAYRKNFDLEVLQTHRGWDIGALKIAKELAKRTNSKLLYSETSRLLVDLNRSINKKGLFSEFIHDDHETILDKYYRPYRATVEAEIKSSIQDGFRVFHFSVHSFTPILNGEERNCEVGLLYDPSRKIEKSICANLAGNLKSGLRTRLNYPYKGTADGFTTSLRRAHPESRYCGIELELNQRWLMNNKKGDFASRLSELILDSINLPRTRK